jgi:hypothetical protein
MRIPEPQRSAVAREMRDALSSPATFGSRNGLLTYDAIDLACDTSNYWWTGLDNRECMAGLRAVNRGLRWSARMAARPRTEVAS